MKKDWVDLPFCFCGLYYPTTPCPTCPPVENQVITTDTLQWTVQSTTTQSSALSLKDDLIGALGYTFTLTTAEQQSLSGTHTETTTFTLRRQAIGCFTRYYRQVWYKRSRTGKQYTDWTYSWIARKASGESCGQAAQTYCSELTAYGKVIWNTFPNYEWAPSEPPCGGVPISSPDPWDGKREKPCCEPLCPPPPLPALPCCGCLTNH